MHFSPIHWGYTQREKKTNLLSRWCSRTPREVLVQHCNQRSYSTCIAPVSHWQVFCRDFLWLCFSEQPWLLIWQIAKNLSLNFNLVDLNKRIVGWESGPWSDDNSHGRKTWQAQMHRFVQTLFRDLYGIEGDRLPVLWLAARCLYSSQY